MAFDGAYLFCIARELRGALGAHVEKIHQPAREELLLALRWRGGAGKLLLSASAASPRIQFTAQSPENPKAPPMFCMLLRKHLGSGKLVGVRQEGLERILYLDFEATNEMGDLVTLTLAVEIMGRHSNIILCDGTGKILDAIKRVDAQMSSVRQVLPGMAYTLPPAQQTCCLLDADPAEAAALVRRFPKDAELSKCILGSMQGLSPIVCREAAYFAVRGRETNRAQVTPEEWERLRFWFARARRLLEEDRARPVLVLDEDGRPADFAFLPIEQYGHARFTREYDGFSALLDDFYSERSRMERMKQRSHDLLTLLTNTSERIARRTAAQREELAASQQRDTLRLWAELLTANSYALEKGRDVARLQNYYDPELAEVEIPLDPLLTPTQNAQRYFSEYRKAATAEQKLTERIAAGEEQLAYLDTVFDAVTRSQGEAELSEIRAELAGQGYIKRSSLGRQKPARLPPLRFRSDDGLSILVGRNNTQNDRLTLKEARKQDLWLHAQRIPGSHVIVETNGEPAPARTVEQAAVLAALHSKARDSALVPVDYAEVRFVKKPTGAAPGKVIYTDYHTAYVRPDETLAQRLAEQA